MKYRIPEHVLHQMLNDEVVILDAQSDTYFGLNGTAAVIWEALERKGTITAAIGAVMDQFDVAEITARADVLELLIELESRFLIEEVCE